MIYFDNNATTRLADPVVKKMSEVLAKYYGNPSSAYSLAKASKDAITEARAKLAELLGAANPTEVVFTSGGTESDNWAILGALESEPSKRHVVTTRVEHEAVRNVCVKLEQNGYPVSWLDVDERGQIDLSQLKESLRPDTAVVSIMLANNETGVVFPVEEAAEIVKAESEALFHVDGVNAAGKMPLSIKETEIDLFSVSGHKFYGPKGVGALYIRSGVEFPALNIGGGQEGGRRAGTEAVHQIVGIGEAAVFVSDMTPMKTVEQLRDSLESSILRSIPNSSVNGAHTDRLVNTTNISFENTNGEMIISKLNDLDICASTGSACNEENHEASPVLKAMDIPYSKAMGSIRFSLGRFNSIEEVELVSRELPGIVADLRR